MSTSGSFDWNLTRDEIITMAFQRCGAIEDGDSLSVTQIAMAASFLETLIKSLSDEGMTQVFFTWVTQTFVAASAVIGDTDMANYRCIYPHTSTAANRPTTGPEWPIYWVQDNAAAGVTWVITTPYTSPGAYAKPAGVIGVNQAYLRWLGTDYQMEIKSSRSYKGIINKGAIGRPEIIYLDRKPQIMFLHPQPDQISPTYLLRLQYVMQAEDFDAAGNEADIPKTGLRMLSYGLAYDLSFPLGLPPNERLLIKNEYFETKRNFLGMDKESIGIRRPTCGSMIV